MTRRLHEAKAFFQRRLHHSRLRTSALHALEGVTGHRDERLRLAFRDADVPPDVDASDEPVVARAPAPPIETIPRLDVVILVVGSRGDVQPFIPIGRRSGEAPSRASGDAREFRPSSSGRASNSIRSPPIRTN